MRLIDSFLRMAFVRGARERDGILEIGGSVAVFIPAKTFVDLQSELAKRWGAASAREVLFQLGRMRTLAGATAMRPFAFVAKAHPRPFLGRPFAQAVMDIWRMTGWGVYRITRYDSDGALIRATTPIAKVFVQTRGFAREPVCDFVCGMLAGGMESAHGGGYDCIERACAATGQRECTFELFRRPRRASTSRAPRGRSQSSSRRSRMS